MGQLVKKSLIEIHGLVRIVLCIWREIESLSDLNENGICKTREKGSLEMCARAFVLLYSIDVRFIPLTNFTNYIMRLYR